MKTSRSLILLALLIVSCRHEAQAFYNASTGRWLSRDPIGEGDGPNPYHYVRNRSTVAVDWAGKITLSTVPTTHSDASGRSVKDNQLAEFTRALLADRVRFENTLISLCPNCPVEFETGQREGRSRLQTCTLNSCLAQARLLANALASKYMVTFTTEFQKFGNILVGWRGNGRADGAPWHGMSGADHDKGFGLKCAGWMDLTADEFFKAIRPFSQEGSQCFRAARVGKPEDRDSIFNHSWILVYGPKRGQLSPSMYKKGDFDVAIDPWPVGGKAIMNPYPYEAKRLDAPLLW